LVDLTLPSIDGIELAKRIRQTPEMAPKPLVGLTGNMDADDRRRAVDAGFDEFLPMPFMREELAEILSRVEARIVASKARSEQTREIAQASRALNQKSQEGLAEYRRRPEPPTFNELFERFETCHVLTGRVKRIISAKQFGFIKSPGRPDTLFFASNVADGQFDRLSKEQEVEFVLRTGSSRARSVKPLPISPGKGQPTRI
jgi:DNA-binding NarL/FixJ family response regulator